MINAYWDKALRLLETTKVRKGVEVLATLAVIYGVTVLLWNTLWFKKPTTPVEWAQWGFHVFFNGIVLPILGIFNRLDHNKALDLTKQIYSCVTKEMALVKELSLNTHKLVKKVLDKPECDNYKPKDTK